MDIIFDNPKHQRLINDPEALAKKYNKTKGVDTASDILTAMNVLDAATTMFDIPPSYRPHPLLGVYKGSFAVDVNKKYRIIFKPNHDDDPDYRIDNPKSIKSITIVEIYTNYHKS